ncbi:MAG: zinc ribbon domain-containing protein [Candidatus Omnitrophica bacterium]|nr:zinc ribbon domain-containing protein [Candidatus Omnitrophota bacterium]
MPTYQYECEACGHLFEALQSMIEKKLKKCPKCAKMSLVRHIGGGSGIIFKGTGFYETDYKNKPPASKSSPDSGGGHCHSGGCGCASTPAVVKKEASK